MYLKLPYFFPAKPVILPDKWTLLRGVGKKTLSFSAQLRLEWIIFYFTVGKENTKKTSSHFGISRKTFHKWIKRFNEKNLRTLEEKSKAPKKKRDWMVTRTEEDNIKKLRKKNMELGKKKIQRLYLLEYKKYISTRKIERVIRRYNLYPDPIEHKHQIEKRKNSKIKLRMNQVKKIMGKKETFGFLWHIDTIIIWWYGQKRVIFTAIEDLTKIAFAKIYPTNSSGYGGDFLKRLMYLVEGKVDIMHQDNGSEFQGAFEKACKTFGIIQAYSRPYTPRDNPSLERFNKTLQEEWLRYSEVGLDDIIQANKDLTGWLVKYNSYRPHQALDYRYNT